MPLAARDAMESAMMRTMNPCTWRSRAALACGLLAALAWAPEALAAGWAAVATLKEDMDHGRQVRLRRLGFDESQAAALSTLHTRNFM